MAKTRITALLLLVAGALIGFFVYYSEINPGSSFYKPFKLGLDLSGGSRLTYLADVSKLDPANIDEAMSSLREVIDRRVNVFGVSEPIVQVEKSGLSGGQENRLVVELPGVTDVKEAAKMISATPSLEFKIERPEGPEKTKLVAAAEAYKNGDRSSSTLAALIEDPYFIPSGLTGQYLKRAQVTFNQNSIGPSISVEFNDEGAKLFGDLTTKNVGKPIGIYLDNQLISAPVVREAIRNGQAEISGQFTVDEAKTLARDLNLGALPVPIKLVSTQTIGATLGTEAAQRGIEAGIIGLLLVAVFMIVWYRLPGLISVIALSIYVALMLAIFKLVPVTLTAAGIAGFILSIGIAVDANVLIFERFKEEIKRGRGVPDAMKEGFSRAWLSIRDSNLSSIISAVILFWFGTSLIKGFALTFALGVVISMFTAITVTRTLLLAMGITKESRTVKFLFGSAFFKS